MKKYAKSLKEYEKIDFDTSDILSEMSRLKGARRKPTSVALDAKTIKDLKNMAETRSIPYQILMRLLITDGLRRMKKAV
jgi:hypothetical protein